MMIIGIMNDITLTRNMSPIFTVVTFRYWPRGLNNATNCNIIAATIPKNNGMFFLPMRIIRGS